MYLKTPPHLLLWDESAWSVSQWSRNSYSKFLEKKNTPSQRLVINSLLAAAARKKRICHSGLSLFGYSGCSATGTFASTTCTNANYFSASTWGPVTLVYRAQPHSSYKNSNNKGPVDHRKKDTNIAIRVRTAQPGSQKNCAGGKIFWQGVRDTLFSTEPAAVRLCHWYKMRPMDVCTSAVSKHITLRASVRKWNSCNPNQISFSPWPQRGLKLLKVPDLHLRRLSFQGFLFETG